MKPTIQFFRASTGALFARIATTARELTMAVEATDEQAVRQEAADMRARAARLIDRAAFIESVFEAGDDSATPWVAVPHPMLEGVFAVKRTVTLTDASQRVEYVGFMDKPVGPDRAVNYAWRQNAVMKAATLNADTVMETRTTAPLHIAA
jgi:hypothetical protein